MDDETAGTGARADRDHVLDVFLLNGVPVATVLDGAGTATTSSPRPFLHPVRTLGGTTVSAHHPVDHDWHCGVGFGFPDVDGVNCWGGRTFVRGVGYVWRDDHGSATVTDTERDGAALRQEITWRGPDRAAVLHEDRSLTYRSAAYRPVGGGWELTWSSSFRTPGDEDVHLGSPGSNGRDGAGYGGFFWRFPPCSDIVVRTPDAEGEHAAHGSTAEWLEWSAVFGAASATIRLEALDHRDPWFVRAAEYPAIGSALAWSEPAVVRPGAPVVRSFRATIADGTLGDGPATLFG